MMKQITEQEHELKRMLHNPVYAGVGGYPPLVDDETFASTMERNVEADGASETLHLMRSMLEETFGHTPDCVSGEDWVVRSMSKISQMGVQQFFMDFVKMLRSELSK